MRAWLRKWWPWGKKLLAVAILAAIGRWFALHLKPPEQGPNPWEMAWRPGWLALSGGLYILGLGLSACFWYRLLGVMGQHLSVAAAVRAYYVGHLGKYLPGKAWALILRASLAQGPGVRTSAAVVTSFYEVLTTMAAGSLLAAVLLGFLAPDTAPFSDWSALRRMFTIREPDPQALDRKALVVMALVLLAVTGGPILPPIFNWLVRRMSLPFQDATAPPLPGVPLHILAEGLLVTAGGWLLLGASLWALLQALLPQGVPLTWETWGWYSALLALAYVAGFVVILLPNGLGVRELFLNSFLLAELARIQGGSAGNAVATVVVAVWLLRLVWFAAEMVVVSVVYWLPGPGIMGKTRVPVQEE